MYSSRRWRSNPSGKSTQERLTWSRWGVTACGQEGAVVVGEVHAMREHRLVGQECVPVQHLRVRAFPRMHRRHQGDFIFAFGDVRLDVAVVLSRQPAQS